MSAEPSSETAIDRDEDTTSSDDESVPPEPVESLVAGRNKRVTAGNRLSSLLEKEGDDELELLFAEDEEEEDIEFEGGDGEDASDVQLDSSSDDGDQGPAAGDDELEGEREIQRQDKADRQKKRKAQEVFKRPQPLRKRVKLEDRTASTPLTTPTARPKKKSERISWIPAPEEGPTRSSSRKQTVQNKEVVHQRMQEHEKRRRHQIEVMEAASKRKEASKPKTMTQADRMAEAARTEKKNAKSLNRWEAAEKKRTDEQKARLAALHNRQLQGPVVSWWSGISKWVNGKLAQVGVKKTADGGLSHAGKDETSDETLTMQAREKQSPDERGQDASLCGPLQPPELTLSAQERPESNPALSEQQSQTVALPHPLGLLEGIHDYASLPPQPPLRPPHSSTFPPSSPRPLHAPQHLTVDSRPEPIAEYATQNLVIFKNIDANAVRLPEVQNHVLLRRRNGKLPSTFPAFPCDVAV